MILLALLFVFASVSVDAGICYGKSRDASICMKHDGDQTACEADMKKILFQGEKQRCEWRADESRDSCADASSSCATWASDCPHAGVNVVASASSAQWYVDNCQKTCDLCGKTVTFEEGCAEDCAAKAPAAKCSAFGELESYEGKCVGGRCVNTKTTVDCGNARLCSVDGCVKYVDGGAGKCTKGPGPEVDGVDYSYKSSISLDQCREDCTKDSSCKGYSYSEYNNCLLWLQDSYKAGGAAWGDAHCWLKQDAVDLSARSTVVMVVPSSQTYVLDVLAFVGVIGSVYGVYKAGKYLTRENYESL